MPTSDQRSMLRAVSRDIQRFYVPCRAFSYGDVPSCSAELRPGDIRHLRSRRTRQHDTYDHHALSALYLQLLYHVRSTSRNQAAHVNYGNEPQHSIRSGNHWPQTPVSTKVESQQSKHFTSRRRVFHLYAMASRNAHSVGGNIGHPSFIWTSSVSFYVCMLTIQDTYLR